MVDVIYANISRIMTKSSVVWCIAIRSKDDFIMSETLLFRKELSQLGWQPLHYMLKKQNFILHGTKCKSKDIEGMIEESRKEIIPTHQTHGVTKLCEPEA